MHTLELLSRAEAEGTPLRQLAIRLGLNPNALANAKNVGRLSPAIAATLAHELGEDPARWALTAVGEMERSPTLRKRVNALLKADQVDRRKR